MIQRIVNNESGFKCLKCGSKIRGITDSKPYICRNCGQIHLVSMHPMEKRIILTKNEYSGLHKKFPISKETELKAENAKLRLELKKKELLMIDLNNKIGALEQVNKKITRKIRELTEE